MQRELAGPTMKTQTFGRSHSQLNCYSSHYMWNKLWKISRNDALTDYRENRVNGDKADNPSRAFPADGTYSDWILDREGANGAKWYCIKYTEGPGDRAWMEEKDRNYLARLKREEQVKDEKKVTIEKPGLPAEEKIIQKEKYATSSTNAEYPQKPQSSEASLPTLFSNPSTNIEDESTRVALQITKRAVMQAKRKVKFSDAFKTALIEMVKKILVHNNKELIEKLRGDSAVKMRRSLANAIFENIINDIDATATDSSDYDYLIEDAIADWKNSNEEWRQICSGMQKN